MIKCVKCEQEATFSSPDNLCDEHWAEWWVNGIEPESEQEIHKKQVLETIKENKD